MRRQDLLRGLGLAMGSVGLVSMAQLLWKVGMMRLPPLDELWGIAPASIHLFDLPSLGLIVAGIGGYVLSMYLWLQALGRLPLSLAYPLLSLSFLLVYLASVLMPELHEPVSALRLCGVVLIVLGNVVAWTPLSAEDR